MCSEKASAALSTCSNPISTNSSTSLVHTPLPTQPPVSKPPQPIGPPLTTLHLSTPANLPHHPHPVSTFLPTTKPHHNPLIYLPTFFYKEDIASARWQDKGSSFPVRGLEGWRARGESEHIVCGSPRGTCLYSARNHTSCRDRYLIWACLQGRADMGSAPSPQPGSCCPAIILWERQGKPKLSIQNPPVS